MFPNLPVVGNEEWSGMGTTEGSASCISNMTSSGMRPGVISTARMALSECADAEKTCTTKLGWRRESILDVVE
jgi:hypothetical protein